MEDTQARPRVLLTRSFIDSHDRAIETIALALRDAAMEVVLIDYEQPEDVVTVALQEDVDVIGVILADKVDFLSRGNGSGD